MEHDPMLAVTPRHGQGGDWRFALGLASAAPDASTTESLPHSHSRSRDVARYHGAGNEVLSSRADGSS